MSQNYWKYKTYSYPLESLELLYKKLYRLKGELASTQDKRRRAMLTNEIRYTASKIEFMRNRG